MPFDQGLTMRKFPQNDRSEMRARFVAKLFVPILYQDRAFDAFDDFSDFVESISCAPSESCQVRGSNPCRGAIA
jgi:hypothetical protein